jgi:exonuclease V gamma subunit
MPIKSHHVTRMTDMGDILAGLIGPGKRPDDKLFCKELILVDGKALSNWLSNYLVREAKVGQKNTGLGVHAHADLMNTHRFAPWAAAILKGEEPGSSFKDPLESLELRVHGLLCDGGNQPGATFKDVIGQPDRDGGMVRWEVSQRIASRLRELLLDDPDWVQTAQTAPNGDRLALLWNEVRRQIQKETGESFISAFDIMKLLQEDDGACERLRSQLPGRITLLASGDIPRTLLCSLAALGKAADFDVQGIFLQPTLGYHLDLKKWETIPDDLNTPGADFIRQTAAHFQNQFAKLVDKEVWNFGGDAKQERDFPKTMLGAIQGSIARFDDIEATFDLTDDPEKETVALHRCHSVVREAEVLRDELLKAMAADKDLRPRDILILSPDPETYAAILQGVFRKRGTPDIYLTHVALEGTGKTALTSLADALLALPAGRCTAQEVLELAELQIIRDRYHWDAGDTATIKQWFKSAPFFWGADAEHRERLTEVKYGEWSLADFRARLILGTAMAPDTMLAGEPLTLTLGAIEGKQSALLAAELIHFTDLLRTWIHYAGEKRPLAEWVSRLAETLKTLMPDSPFYAEESAKMERALGGLAELAKKATPEPVGLSLFSAFAAPLLDLDHGKGQFMSGGVVLAPLRSSSIHPAKVIVLLGMKDGSYPARGQSPGPELKTKLPQKSGRLKQQSEQRGMHAIILAIGAAQNRLIATFPGYAGATGKEANAALPIELIKQASNRLLEKDGGRLRIHRHGIHAHEAASGTSKEICEEYTYDTQALAAAAVLRQSPVAPMGELTIRPNRPYETWSFDEWVEFWLNPAKGLFESLDLKTVWLEDELPADEALTPPALEGTMTVEQRTTKYQAINWVQDYLARNQTENGPASTAGPKLHEAVLSGYFSQQATQDHLDAIVAEANPSVSAGWEQTIQKYFGEHPIPLNEIVPKHHSKHFPSAYYVRDWLILVLPSSKEVKEKHLMPGLAALAKIQAELSKNKTSPTELKSHDIDLKNVAVFGMTTRNRVKKDADGKTIKDDKGQSVEESYDTEAALGVTTTSTKISRTLKKALEKLAANAAGNDYFMGGNITAKVAQQVMNGKEANGSYESQVFGSPPFSKGDVHDRHGRLIMPARFKPSKIAELFKNALEGCAFKTDAKMKNDNQK